MSLLLMVRRAYEEACRRARYCSAVVHDIVNPTHANKGGSGEASAFCLLSVVGRVITNCVFSR